MRNTFTSPHKQAKHFNCTRDFSDQIFKSASNNNDPTPFPCVQKLECFALRKIMAKHIFT